jgi:hypothetical protein
MREKLIELLTEYFGVDPAYYGIEARHLADHLIANGVTIQKWIPVTERLPDTDIRVLVWVGENDCHFPTIDTDRVHGTRWVRWDGYITHWMPLPEAPKEDLNG